MHEIFVLSANRENTMDNRLRTKGEWRINRNATHATWLARIFHYILVKENIYRTSQ